MLVGSRKWRILFLLVLVLMLAGTFVQVVAKVQDGKTAFVRWMPDTAKLLRREMIYSSGPVEGFPAPPMGALLLVPFHAMGSMAGSVAWFVLKCLVITGILWCVRSTSAVAGKRLPDWAMLLLLLLSWYVFTADLSHGNMNLIVGGLVALSLVLGCRGRALTSGLAIGAATAIKVTPLLFLPYLLYKRRWRAAVGAVVGLVLFGWFLPAIVLGFGFTGELLAEWWRQMVAPFAGGAPVAYLQTGHANQSLTGAAYRLLADTVAVRANVSRGTPDVNVNLLSLEQRTVAWLLKALFLTIAGTVACVARTPRSDRKALGNLGEYAIVFLAMLLISERSWKHHFVLVILPHAFVLQYLLRHKPGVAMRALAIGTLAGSAACHNLFLGGVIGKFRSDIAEAYGVYTLGALFLFVGCSAILLQLKRAEGSV